MFKALLIMLIALIAIDVYAKDDVREKDIFEDKPIYNFVDAHYSCTVEELMSAKDHFKKCDGTPVFRDCYAEAVMKHCTRKLF